LSVRILCSLTILGFSSLKAEEPPHSDPDDFEHLSSADQLPRVGLAEDITQVTGVAISPLFEVSGVGA